jgi:hypothetical protein
VASVLTSHFRHDGFRLFIAYALHHVAILLVTEEVNVLSHITCMYSRCTAILGIVMQHFPLLKRLLHPSVTWWIASLRDIVNVLLIVSALR